MKYKNKKLQIACDGGAATGKSTGAKMISKKYRLSFLSSGLLYRYAALLLIKNKPNDKIKFLKYKFKKLNYKKLEDINLHTQKISQVSAEIAKIVKIRNVLKKFQLDFAKKNERCCIEGRDISTKILPKSDVKFFFICDLNTASKRRYKELKKTKLKVSLFEVKKALKLRNISDKKRQHSPLKKHKNAIVVNTGKLNKQAMLQKMSLIIENFLKSK